jgi:hypothetical protein
MIVLMKHGWKGYPHSIIFEQWCGLQMQKLISLAGVLVMFQPLSVKWIMVSVTI